MKKTFIIISSVLIISLAFAIMLKASDKKKPEALKKISGKWILEKMDNKKLLKNTKISLDINEKSMHGSGGCNNYQTDFERDEKNIKLSKSFMITEKACGHKILEQEAFFTSLLQSSKFYFLQGNLLTLKNEKGQSLIFKR